MLGRRRGGSSSKSQEQPTNTGTAVDADTGQGAATGVSQFITQLDESATKRLHRMNQRLRLLEQQMETLETDVAKASRDSYKLLGNLSRLQPNSLLPPATLSANSDG